MNTETATNLSNPATEGRRAVSEAELRAMTGRGMGVPEISRVTGQKESMLRAALSVLGIRSGRMPGRPKVVDAHACAERVRRGETCTEIAASIGVTRGAVHKAMTAAGYQTTLIAMVKADLGANNPK